MSDTRDTIKQLDSAREIVLKDAAIYSQVVSGVLPVIHAERPVELRRWGADFLAETFASPVVSAQEKQSMSLSVLDTLKSYLNRKEERGEEEDESVVKSAVQCAASIYPLVFRHTISHADDKETWAKMASMKSTILRRLDTAPAGVRICCIKFVARVVQVQTPGVIADPRRSEQNEISLALVPRDHAIIPPSNLEAEASGLLDRLLGVLQENVSDALIVTATLNSLSSLTARRATISSKILSTVLSFNPLKLAQTTKMDGKDKIAIKSMTRTTMSFLLNVLKRNPNHALAGRIQQQVERLRHSLTEVFSDQNPLKRAAPDEPTDGLSDDKRQKLDREAAAGTTPQQQAYAPLPSGPVSLAQLFTLTNDQGAAGFHVEAIPQHFVAQLVPPLLASINAGQFDAAINAVRSRYLEVQRRPPPTSVQSGADDEDDDYDPSQGFGDSEQAANQADQLGDLQGQPELAIAPFHLPPPPALNERERAEYEETARERLFGGLEKFDEEARRRGRKQQENEKGFHRVVAEREGWIALLTRLVTRARASHTEDDEAAVVKQENDDRSIATKKKGDEMNANLPRKLRDALFRYIMDDWRRRLDIAIAWLTEEWYADRLLATSPEGTLPNYTPLTLTLLNSLTPYLDTKDTRHLLRLLSEIPHLPPQIFTQILPKLADDPERVGMVSQALLYLCMLRPPVREAALDCAVEIWRANREARGGVGKVLGRWRPGVLEQLQSEDGGEVKREG